MIFPCYIPSELLGFLRKLRKLLKSPEVFRVGTYFQRKLYHYEITVHCHVTKKHDIKLFAYIRIVFIFFGKSGRQYLLILNEKKNCQPAIGIDYDFCHVIIPL